MIRYDLISKAIKHYKKLGYFYLDVPWIVDENIIKITLPSDKKSFSIDNHSHLVGSAEQSFLHMIINEDLPSGKYIAATPCFRDDIVDDLHQKTFFKVELITFSKKGILSQYDVDDVVNDAKKVLKKLSKREIKSVKTSEGYDLEIDNIEIGSYGLRRFNNFNWVYGTGLAEPRFSKISKCKL